MKRQIINDILRLKQDDGYNILTISVSKKQDKFNLTWDIDMNFYEDIISSKILADILAASTLITQLYWEYISNDIKKCGDEYVPLLVANIVADEEGPCSCIYTPYIGKYVAQESDNLVEDILNQIQESNSLLTANIEKIVSDFLMEQETKHIYGYEFALDIDDKNNISFSTEVVPKSNISEYKHRVRELLNDGFLEKLYPKIITTTNNFEDKKSNSILCNFFTDGYKIYDLDINYFTQNS